MLLPHDILQLGCSATAQAEGIGLREIGSWKQNFYLFGIISSGHTSKDEIQAVFCMHRNLQLQGSQWVCWATYDTWRLERRRKKDLLVLSVWCCLSAASSECRSSPVSLSHWEAWLGWLYGTWSLVRISQPRTKTASLLPREESNCLQAQDIKASKWLRVLTAIFASSKEFERTEILHSCWFYSNCIHVRLLPAQHSFLFEAHVNSDFPVLLP